MNYYEILGIAPDASPSDIDKAFRKLQAKYHPDRNKDSDPIITAAYKQVSEAYEVLKDPLKRKAYDSNLVGGSEPKATKKGKNILGAIVDTVVEHAPDIYRSVMEKYKKR